MAFRFSEEAAYVPVADHASDAGETGAWSVAGAALGMLPARVVVVRAPSRTLSSTRCCGLVTVFAADGEWSEPEGTTTRSTEPATTSAMTTAMIRGALREDRWRLWGLREPTERKGIDLHPPLIHNPDLPRHSASLADSRKPVGNAAARKDA
jgi:hypothetical protein